MSTEDSGVIDLFALSRKGAEQTRSPFSEPPISAPGAFAFDTSAASLPTDDEDDGAQAIALASKTRKRNVLIGVGAAAGLMLISIVAFTAGGTPSAPSAKDAKLESASTKTVAAAVAPPPVVEAPPPTPEVAPPPSAPAPVAATPAPPSTGAHGAKSAAPKRPHAKAKSSGPKLQKIQSGGVP